MQQSLEKYFQSSLIFSAVPGTESITGLGTATEDYFRDDQFLECPDSSMSWNYRTLQGQSNYFTSGGVIFFMRAKHTISHFETFLVHKRPLAVARNHLRGQKSLCPL